MQSQAKENNSRAGDPSAAIRPRSCVNHWTALLGLAGFLLSLALMFGSPLSAVHRSFISLGAATLPMVLLELLVLRAHRHPSAQLVWPTAQGGSWMEKAAISRIAIKLVGLAGTIAAIAIGYWLFPIYQEAFYRPFWVALREVGPWLLAAALPYFVYIDRRMAEPCDGYWHAGMAVLGRFERVDIAQLRQHALGWIIKGYFLPLMFVYLTNAIEEILSAGLWHSQTGFMPVFRLGWDLAFAVDLVFATLGYCLTLRLLDSHIRSSEPTFLGWAVTLVCYQPFSGFFFNRYLDYQDNLFWSGWLAELPTLQILWGCLILSLLAFHAWSVMAFGCRFSNLTHRGILTHGPFRWTKHPSYLSKNLVWWMVSVPFFSGAGLDEAIRNSVLLIGVNLIYFLRARTEERHLSRDPAYVAYALWIEQNGILRRIGTLFPFLRYRPR